MRPPHDPDRSRLDARDRADLDRPFVSPAGQFARGVGVAIGVDTLVNVPSVLFLPLLRPQNLASALGTLLLGVNVVIGYVGGRAAGRAGTAHDDDRAQWNMAWTVTLLSTVIAYATARAALHWPRIAAALHAATRASGAGTGGAVWLGVRIAFVLLLVRFGFAIGTFAQARRDGLGFGDDEAGAE